MTSFSIRSLAARNGCQLLAQAIVSYRLRILRPRFIAGGHFLHEEKPDEVNAALLAFLGEIGK